MAAISGRNIGIKWDGTAVAGARSDEITINNEPLDITSKSSNGWRTFIAEVGLRSVDLSIDGVLINDTLLAAAMGAPSGMLESCEVEIDGFGTLAGSFFLNNYAPSGGHDNEATFTASLQSSGAITYTPE